MKLAGIVVVVVADVFLGQLCGANEVAPDEGPPGNGKAETKAGKQEFNFFPVAGGDSDVGVGLGQFSDWAKLAPTPGAFYWKVEDATFITFKLRNSSFIIPYLDLYALLTLPGIGPGGRFRLEVRPSYTDERTLGYYGMGNAANAPPGTTVDQTQYGRTHPTLAVKLKYRLFDRLFLSCASNFTQSWLTIASNSLLVRDQQTGTPETKRLLGSFTSHATELLEADMEYDTRDNETIPSVGQYQAISARVSPGIASWMPYTYLQLDATSRFYVTIIPHRLGLSVRVVADAFLGSPPFYELARFDDTPAIGGGKAIRGVPAQRYYGKVKLFENFELHGDLFPFHIKKKEFVLGVATFFDAGRTWTELFHAHPELDGTGLGLKYGIGGGLRLQEGKTFVVRADVAWSPDATPIGAYVDAGELF